LSTKTPGERTFQFVPYKFTHTLEIRNKYGLKSGTRFLVLEVKNVLILKTLKAHSIAEFDALIKKDRKRVRTAGLKNSDIIDAVSIV